MSALQASRRVFLNNLAILSAGVALGNNAASIFSNNYLSPDLEKCWKTFCQQQLAKLYSGILETRKEIVTCKGHEHREGDLMHFPEDNLIAQPLWVYWAVNKNKPSDVIINFYKDGVAIGTLNQFELKALYETKDEASPLTAFLKANNGEQGLYVAKQKSVSITIPPPGLQL